MTGAVTVKRPPVLESKLSVPKNSARAQLKATQQHPSRVGRDGSLASTLHNLAGGYTCAQQKAWGQCSQAWMTSGG